MTSFLRVAFVFVVVSCAHGARADDGAPPVEQETPALPDRGEDEGAVWSFIYAVNEIYPIVLDPHLEPEVEDSLVLFWGMVTLCGWALGPLWIPMVAVGEWPGADYFLWEALWTIFNAWLTITFGAGTSWFGLGLVLLAVDAFYRAPVATIDIYDRALKRERARTNTLHVVGPPDRAPLATAMPY
jgi:hypothetical protein